MPAFPDDVETVVPCAALYALSLVQDGKTGAALWMDIQMEQHSIVKRFLAMPAAAQRDWYRSPRVTDVQIKVPACVMACDLVAPEVQSIGSLCRPRRPELAETPLIEFIDV